MTITQGGCRGLVVFFPSREIELDIDASRELRTPTRDFPDVNPRHFEKKKVQKTD